MKSWLRNVLLISSIVILWAALLLSVLFYQRNSVLKTEKWVNHSYAVVTAGKDLEADISQLISKQRGYIITGEDSYIEEYLFDKQKILNTIDQLAELTSDSSIHQEYVSNLTKDFTALIALLDERIEQAKKLSRQLSRLNNTLEVRRINDSMQNMINTLLASETRVLEKQLATEELKKKQYAIILYSGIISSILLILGLNAAVFRSNYRRMSVEKENREMQERMALAMSSTSDSIFDWNMEDDSIYLSPRYKQQLGYGDDDIADNATAIINRIHPDDKENVKDYLQRYLEGEIEEYSQVYRTQHKDGHWLWLNSRGRAIFNDEGKPVRFVGAHTNITHIKEIEENLRHEKEAAIKSNKAKSEFLANMSHEIRTPLNSIIGVSNILAKSKTLNEDQRTNLIKTLQSSSISLLDLINDVLDFAKIESGELKIDNREFEIEPLFDQVESIMAIKANEKGVQFKINAEELIFATQYGDEMRVRQILLNLIGNAIKFTEKGSVSVSASHADNNLIISVHDTGIGMPKEIKDKLFKKFEQGDASVNRKYGGTGLGLAISQQLAQLMGGRIVVDSTENIGSTFTLTLPVQKDKLTKLTKKAKKTIPAKREASTKKILIAEDYEGNIIVLRFLLENLGVEFDIARNGAEAVEMYKAAPYPLVLMDVQMPEVDGFEATRRIRDFESQEHISACVIIAMTAHALAGDSARCIEAGMNDYLSKPLMEADLTDRFEKHLFKPA
ncbi:MAG: ATP-binding protein [Alphaproteobacteria bacterium]|nr:ATP-binding protein [Alphaproteobacteria bacterium]